jgi:hypothetical protein
VLVGSTGVVGVSATGAGVLDGVGATSIWGVQATNRMTSPSTSNARAKKFLIKHPSTLQLTNPILLSFSQNLQFALVFGGRDRKKFSPACNYANLDF